ncbi:MAG: PEP-CTERM sorting domain-containing protein [Planctomycetes bacterium]|nr:PEP-CTERM sorting domain-containing protein [Planctomycetota bacterium]
MNMSAYCGPVVGDATFGAELKLSIVATPPIPGDVDGDWDVDTYDLNALVAEFGLTDPPHTLTADFNDDDMVDLDDFAMLRGNFGFGVASAPDAEFGAATPEPTTLTLLALGGLAILRRRRKQQQACTRHHEAGGQGG